VHPPFGPLFTRNFLVNVDECARISEIIERSTSRSNLGGDRMIRGCDRLRYFLGTKGTEVAGLYGKHP
jgi:hypothetical protein